MTILARTIAQPVVDSLLIVQMKRDILRGSEDLQTFSRVSQLIGTMFFNLYGAHILSNYRVKDFFYLPLVTGVLLFFATLFYPKKSENSHHDDHSMNTIKGFSDKRALIKQFLNVKEIRNSLIFFVIVSFVVPNYEEFVFIYNEATDIISLNLESILAICVGISATILLLIYN